MALLGDPRIEGRWPPVLRPLRLAVRVLISLARGTRLPARTGRNRGLLPRCPAVSTIDNGFCPCSRLRCSFAVTPPATGSTRDPPVRRWSRAAARPAGPPFPRTRRMLMRPRDRGIHADIPRDPPSRPGRRRRFISTATRRPGAHDRQTESGSRRSVGTPLTYVPTPLPMEKSGGSTVMRLKKTSSGRTRSFSCKESTTAL